MRWNYVPHEIEVTSTPEGQELRMVDNPATILVPETAMIALAADGSVHVYYPHSGTLVAIYCPRTQDG